jgi:DHA2 family multidrug resistance protein-like MFS transporter
MRRWLALAAVVLSSLVLGLDSTILVTALPTLSERLGASTDELQWMSAAYLLTLSGLLIPAGVLGDRLGRRRVLLIALVVFGASSVAASQVTTAGQLIAMRVVMGTGGAFILPISMAVIPTLFSERERPRAIAIGGAGMFLGLPLGPLVAGWLLVNYEWGSIFLINAPVVMAALVGVWLFVPESRDASARRIDLVGALLVMAGVSSVVYGIIEQPRFGWAHAAVATSLLGGAMLLAGFVHWELRARFPLVDLRIFANARFSWSIAVSVVMSFGLMGVLFVFTPFLQIVQGNDAQGTGVRLLPLIAGIVIGAAVSDRLLSRLGVRRMFAVGLVTCGSGMALMSFEQANDGFALLLIALPAIGIGNALAMFTAFNVIFDVLPRAEVAAGIALTRTIGQIGSSLGVAIMGSILNGAYHGELANHASGLPAAIVELAQTSVAVAIQTPLGLVARDAYGVGMSDVLRVSAGGMLAAAVLVAVLMRSPRTAYGRRRETRAAWADAPAQAE